MAINKQGERKYTWLAITSILVAIAVVDKLPLIYKVFGKFDLALILTLIALIFQIYSYYQSLANDAVENLETGLLKTMAEMEARLRSEARDRMERYDRSISNLDLRLSSREDGIEKRLEYVEQAVRQLMVSLRAHEQTPGHTVLTDRVDNLFRSIAIISATLQVRGIEKNAVDQ